MKVKRQRVNVQVKQGKRASNVFESRIQNFDCKVFSNIVFRINSFNEVLGDCWFCYMSKFDLFSDDSLFKFIVV